MWEALSKPLELVFNPKLPEEYSHLFK
jgi:hypothetical protein